MLKWIAATLLICAVLGFGVYKMTTGRSPESAAKQRVEFMMKHMVLGQGRLVKATQIAICTWYAAQMSLPESDVNEASPKWDTWLREGNLPSAPKTFKILGTKMKDPASGRAVVVTVQVDNVKYEMLLDGNQPIKWDS